MVVRLPEENFGVLEGGPDSRQLVPTINSRYYGGLQRWPWAEMVKPFYKKVLNKELATIFRTIKETENDYTGIGVLRQLSTAKTVLAFCNAAQSRNEIITIYSSIFEELKGSIVPDTPVHWHGLDVICVWSLLYEGMFFVPTEFSEFHGVVNEHGLLPDEDACRRFEARYRGAADEGKVEELIEDPGLPGMHFVWIGEPT